MGSLWHCLNHITLKLFFSSTISVAGWWFQPPGKIWVRQIGLDHHPDYWIIIINHSEKSWSSSLGMMTFPIYGKIRSMYGIYANIGGILMVNVTIYSIHGSYGYGKIKAMFHTTNQVETLRGNPRSNRKTLHRCSGDTTVRLATRPSSSREKPGPRERLVVPTSVVVT